MQSLRPDASQSDSRHRRLSPAPMRGGQSSLPSARHLNETLVSGSHDKSAIISDVETEPLLRRLEAHKAEIYAAGFSPDGDADAGRLCQRFDDANVALSGVA
jgi:WD40 repeat protein